MTCRHCCGLETTFDRRAARRDLGRYRRKGPRRTTAALIEALRAQGAGGATVLDIGGGVGAISHALLESGARAATGVDASAAYVEAAREEAERRGLGERLSIRHGDFVALAPDVPEADFVTLDRVICCYPDAAALVGLSAARARRACGLVFPRSTWWTRVALAFVNAVLWLARNPMRTFVHPTALVEDRLRRAGFTRRFHRGYVFWQVMVWSRVARAPGGAPESPT